MMRTVEIRHKPCPNCGRMIPVIATFCPQCGCGQAPSAPIHSTASRDRLLVAMVCVTAVVLGVVWCVRAYIGYRQSEQEAKVYGPMMNSAVEAMRQMNKTVP